MVSESKLSKFGESLRTARIRNGLGLKEISKTTKISLAILEDLENGNESGLPGGVFARSFVRAYAREVGLDPESTVTAFLKVCRAARKSDPVGGGEEAARSAARNELVTAAIPLALMSIPVVAVLIFFGMRAGPENESAGGGQVASEDVSAVSQDPAAGVLIIEVYPSGPCWVSLVADGQQVLAGVVTSNQRLLYEAREGFVLSVGNAGLFNFSINQQLGRRLGVDGETVTFEINRENYRELVAR